MADEISNMQSVDNDNLENTVFHNSSTESYLWWIRNGLLVILVVISTASIIQLLQSFAMPLSDGSIRLSLQGFSQTSNATDNAFSAWLLPAFIQQGGLGIVNIKLLNLAILSVLLCCVGVLFRRFNKKYQYSQQKKRQNKITQECEPLISGEDHLNKVKVIAQKLNPLVKIVSGIAIVLWCVLIIVLIAQSVNALFFDKQFLPWISYEELLSWHEYLFYINYLVSVCFAFSLWFGYQFLTVLSKVLTNLSKGAIFVRRNGKSAFKLAKFYLLGVVSYIPGSIVESYSTSIDCQKSSFSSELIARGGDFLMGDLIVLGLLFITAHIITLAIRLDHEQRLTV